MKKFRRQKDGGQKNVSDLPYSFAVNFANIVSNGIFLSFIFLSWLLFRPYYSYRNASIGLSLAALLAG